MAFYDEIHTTKRFRLGTRKSDVAGNEYIYLKGVASVIVGSPVSYSETFVTALVDTDVAETINSPMAVAMAIVDATTEFGWFMIWGTTSCVAATVADNGFVFATSTAGTLDDTAASIGKVVGAQWRSADASGLATIQLNYPTITNDLSS